MSVEAKLFAVLSPLFGGRVFPDDAPLDTQKPFATYQQIGGAVVGFLDPTVPSKQNGVFQINVWADSRASAAAITLQVESAMILSPQFQASPIGGPIATREQDLKLYGTIRDFDIWSDR